MTLYEDPQSNDRNTLRRIDEEIEVIVATHELTFAKWRLSKLIIAVIES